MSQLCTIASEIISSDIVRRDFFLVEEISAVQVSYEMLLFKYKDQLCVDYKVENVTRNAHLKHLTPKS